MKQFDLTGRVAVVTGIQGQLGSIWADCLLSAGARVAGIDLSSHVLSKSFLSLQKRYGKNRIKLYEANVVDKSSLEQALQRCKKELGIPQILVNNAGIDQPPGNVTSYQLEDIPGNICKSILDVNVLGAFFCMQVFGLAMRKAKKGSIINIGSLYASVSPDARMYDHLNVSPPFLKPPFYGASKAALLNLTKYFSTHWAASGIRVNALSPGGVLGKQDEKFKEKFCSRIPMKRMAKADDLTGPLLFLASDASSYVTGINLNVDGGYTAW